MTHKPSSFSFVTIAAILGVSGIVSWGLYFQPYTNRDTVSIHQFPKAIGDWKSRDIPIREEDYALLETRNAFTRIYKNSQGQIIYVFLVYSQDNRKVSHPPEICYTGSGATVLSRKPYAVNLADGRILRAMKLLLEQGNTQQVALYWYKVGTRLTPSYWKQQILFSLYGLLRKPTCSALIRISTNVNLERDEWGFQATKVLADFSHQIIPIIDEYVK